MNELFIGSLTTGLDLVLTIIKVVLIVWALVGALLCARADAGAFVAHGKWNKWGWFTVCLVSAAVFVLFKPYGFLGVIGVVAVGVFYADVRPAVTTRGR